MRNKTKARVEYVVLNRSDKIWTTIYVVNDTCSFKRITWDCDRAAAIELVNIVSTGVKLSPTAEPTNRIQPKAEEHVCAHYESRGPSFGELIRGLLCRGVACAYMISCW